MLVGACFRSIPQILRISRAKSATGVSLSANMAELLAYSIAVAYNLRLGAIWQAPFSLMPCTCFGCRDIVTGFISNSSVTMTRARARSQHTVCSADVKA